MGNEISLPSPNINPGAVGGGSGLAPNPLDSFIEAYFGAKKQASSESAQAREHEIQLAYLDIAKQKAKNEQAQIDAQAAQHDAQGGAVQAFLKMLQPLGEASAQRAMASGQDPLGSLFGAQQGQGSPIALGGPQAPAQTPMVPQMGNSAPARAIPQGPASPVPNWGQLVGAMTPSAAAAFVEHDLPNLLDAKKSMEGKPFEHVDTGGFVTMADPNTGKIYDPTSGKLPSDPSAWKTAIPKTLSADQKLEFNLRLADTRARQSVANTYKEMALTQNMKWHFLNSPTVKYALNKGQVTMQALLVINDAQKDPDPANRRVLTGQAIASFVVAAEPRAPQLRYQMLKYFKDNIDTRFTGKIETMASLLATGRYRDDQYAGMVHHLENVLKQARSEYERQAAGEIKRNPILRGVLPAADEYFTSDTPNYDIAPPPNLDEALRVSPRPPTP